MKFVDVSENKSLRRAAFSRVATASSGLLYYPKLVALLGLFTLLPLIGRVYFSNELAVSGARVSFAATQADKLAQENYDLENEISSKSSLSYIEAKATQMGLVKTSKIQQIDGVPNVALKE